MAASPVGARGGLGWVILAAALAVPGFLFYNWWSHLKAERDHSISAKASKLAAGGVFQTPPPAAGRLVNPMASTAAPAGAPPVLAGTASTSAPAGAAPALAAVAPALPGPGGAPGAVPGSALAVAPAAAAALTPASGAAAGAAPAAAMTASTNTITLTRDPMMSPMDLVRLREEQLAKEAQERALAEANKPKPEHVHRAPKQKPIETKIELQGIVAKADGENLAIINGSTVNPGESFTVDGYKGRVKVLKITSSEIMLEHNGRKFRLSVNVE